MYKLIFPSRDATIYERWPERNTGTDQILEITKITAGSPVEYVTQNGNVEYWDYNYNSRVLIKFDISELSSSISSGKVGSDARYYLSIKVAEAKNINTDYTLWAYPISGSWTNGTGFYFNDPEVKNGVSWRYRHSNVDGRLWETSSIGNTSFGYTSNPGGGVWYTGSGFEASQIFNYESPDIRMDVTDIVNKWVSSSIPNEGFILKYDNASEQDSSILGSLKFYSKDTHTIFLPRLEVFWDSSDYSGTGSFTEATEGDFVINIKNLQESYHEDEKPKLRLSVRDRYPVPTYATSSHYLRLKRLPANSYYSIMDSVTDETIVPFDSVGTKISCDALGNYIKLDMTSIMPERYYRLVFKCEFDNGDSVYYVDNNYLFKVRRV